MALTLEKFNQGMTAQQYLRQARLNKQAIEAIYGSAHPPAEDVAYFDSLAQPLRLAVFTADWCGDAISTSPAIMRLAESTTRLEMRIFDRDKELELTNSFLPPHRAGTVPVFVVFDQQMQEVAQFIETAKELVPVLDRMEGEVMKETVPPSEQGKPMSELSEQARNAFRGRRTAYRVEHAGPWAVVICHAFASTLRQGLALPPEQRPAQGGTEWPPPQT